MELLLKPIVASNPTLAVRKVFEQIDLKPIKRWNGNDFLGFSRKDLPDAIDTICPDESIITENFARTDRQCNFVKVVSFGTPNFNINYTADLF